MNGIDQVLIALWFLPVVLFIIAPLFLGFVWAPISLFIGFLKREDGQDANLEPLIPEEGTTG